MREVKDKQLDKEAIISPISEVIGDIVGGLTPSKLTTILQSVNDGDTDEFFTLAEEMEERDPHLRSALQTRKLSLAGLDVQVTAVDDDKRSIEIADSVRDNIVNSSDFSDLIVDLMDAIYRGYSVVELIWDTYVTPWRPKYIWRDPRFFRYCPKNFKDLKINDKKNNQLLDMPRHKFIVHEPRVKSTIQLKAGLARSVAWYYLFKNITIKDWVTFIESYAMAMRVGRYHPSASEEEKKVLRRALRDMGVNFYAMFPEGMNIETIEQGGKKASADIYKAKAEYCDAMISKAILGQTMTSDNGSSLSQAQIHNEVRLELQKADARQVSETINRDLVKLYVDYNFGEQKNYPKISLVTVEPEDTEALINATIPLLDRGLLISKSQIMEKLGLKVPVDEHDTLSVNNKEILEKNHLELNTANKNNDDIDDLIDDWGFGDEWQEVEENLAGSFLDGLQKAIDDGLSVEEFARRIKSGEIELNTARLEEQLTKANFLARVLGDNDGREI